MLRVTQSTLYAPFPVDHHNLPDTHPFALLTRINALLHARHNIWLRVLLIWFSLDLTIM